MKKHTTLIWGKYFGAAHDEQQMWYSTKNNLMPPT